MILRGNDGLYYDVDLDGNVKGPLVMRNSHVMAPISPPGYAESILSRLPAADIVGNAVAKRDGKSYADG